MLVVTIIAVVGGAAILTTRGLLKVFLQDAPIPTPRQMHMHIGITIGRRMQTITPITTPETIPPTVSRKEEFKDEQF